MRSYLFNKPFLKESFLILFLLILSSFLIISISSTETDASDYDDLFAGGDGSSDNPYLISNSEHLKNIDNIRYSNQYHFALINDISVEGEWDSLCSDGFQGVFDGQFYSIHSIEGAGGLFYSIGSKGIVKNLNLDVDIYSIGFAGGIADICYGSISSCIVTGSIMVSFSDETNSWKYAGGITCKADGAKLTGCQNSAYVYSNAHPGVAGGIVAYAKNTTITNCINSSSIVGKASHYVPALFDLDETAIAGGIIGEASGVTIKNCVNTGSVIVNSNDAGYRYWNAGGGIIGTLTNSIILENCFYESDSVIEKFNGKEEYYSYYAGTTGDVSKTNVRSLSTEQLKNSATYVDFPNNFWFITDGTYPSIKWISGISITDISLVHAGVFEDITVSFHIEFNTGSSELKTQIIKKKNPDQTRFTVKYSSFTDSIQIQPVNISYIEATPIDQNQLFCIGSSLKDKIEVMSFYTDGFSATVDSDQYSTNMPSVPGEGIISVTFKGCNDSIKGYFHLSNQYGVLLYPFNSNLPMFYVCDKGDSITLPTTMKEGWRFSGYFNKPDNGTLISSTSEFIPNSSMILHEVMVAEDEGTLDMIVNTIVSFFEEAFDSLKSWFESLF